MQIQYGIKKLKSAFNNIIVIFNNINKITLTQLKYRITQLTQNIITQMKEVKNLFFMLIYSMQSIIYIV